MSDDRAREDKESGASPVGEASIETRDARQRFTVSDFLSVMKSVPSVDDEFLDLIEARAQDQPVLQESPWER